MKRQYQGNQQSSASEPDMASTHESANLLKYSGTHDTFGKFPPFGFTANELWAFGSRYAGPPKTHDNRNDVHVVLSFLKSYACENHT
jgi:hypothetical protein